ncbi:MAG: hypothetical protein ACTSR8_17800 [Promethearchaeota archaeon]
MKVNQIDSEFQTILMRKLMTICPLCGRLIFGADIDFSKLNRRNVHSWSATYQHFHTHNSFPEYNLTLYIDANYAVRESIINPILKKVED